MGESEMKMDERPAVRVEDKESELTTSEDGSDGIGAKPAEVRGRGDEEQQQRFGVGVANRDAHEDDHLLSVEDESEHHEDGLLISTQEVIEADGDVETEADVEDDVEAELLVEEHAEDAANANETEAGAGDVKSEAAPRAENGAHEVEAETEGEAQQALGGHGEDVVMGAETEAEGATEMDADNIVQDHDPPNEKYDEVDEDADDVGNAPQGDGEVVTETEIGSETVTSSILEGALKNGTDNTVTLNKMHMDDVREGCDAAQPSSPGHADLRSELARDAESLCDADTRQTSTTPPDAGSISAPSSIKIEGDSDSEEKSAKRKEHDDEDDPDEPAKKLKKEIQQETYLRNKILMEYTDALDMSNMDQIQVEEDKLLMEVQNLDEIAREKERQWNNIIHVKKMKEELLLRIQRQKQVYMMSNSSEASDGEASNHQEAAAGPGTMNGQRAATPNSAGGKQTGRPEAQSLAKVLQQHSLEMNGHDPSKPMFPKGAVRNVQSIIADFRQRHPETVPRRGRRIRNVNGHAGDASNGGNSGAGSGRTAFAAGSGALAMANVAQVRPVDANSEIALLLSSMENGNPDGAQSEYHESSAYKEFIEQLTHNVSERKKAQQQQQQVPPLASQYPEVTVHAVTSSSPTAHAPTNSLLHGILTKAQVKTESRTTFSPTLARLLTAPDKTHGAHPNKSSNVSISDILSTNKARSEITITPVASDYEEGRGKRKQHVEEETEDSVDRLVIDESTDLSESRTDNNSDAGDEVPQCQGCNQKAAQFVCAGCGNQWYCSRECQVTAWDEHSDVCSG